MAYLVELTRRAERDLGDLYDRISAEDAAVAAHWFNGLEEAIYTLERLPLPDRCREQEGQTKLATFAVWSEA
ncbi:MAG: type II toxin-antitoxin system RelE/ParE family toxin [Candidatus Binataceae bacterium]